MLKHYSRALAIILMGFLFTACATQKPQVTHDGLVLVNESSFATVYAKPDAAFGYYTLFSLDDCQVAFKKNWLRDQNHNRDSHDRRVTEKDMDRIKESLSKSCDENFKQALEKGPAYFLIDENSSEDAETGAILIIKPSIINLDVTAPDVHSAGMSRTYTTTSGEMTLYMELFDAFSGEILARIIDRKKSTDNMSLKWTNSVTNKSEADRAMRQWSTKLRKSLDRLRASTP